MKKNKFVLVSGANGGIGKAIVSSLIDDGYSVIALDLSDSNILDFECHFIKCDLTSDKDLKDAYLKVSALTKELFAIVNAAGVFMMQSLIEGSEEDFKKIININFLGIYSLNKVMFPLLNKGSKIINLTSEVARYSPQPLQGYYNVSKIALDSYNDALRREANYLGIKVIKIQSGSMRTNMLGKANEEYEKTVNESKYFKEPMTKLKKMMDKELKKQNDPSLIANLVVRILNKNRTKIAYKVKNSFALSFMGHLPESTQDKIYKKVIK